MDQESQDLQEAGGVMNDYEQMSDTIEQLTKELDALTALSVATLSSCREKLEIYRENSTGKYQGGVEHTSLISMIDTTSSVLLFKPKGEL
jgi:hypothetical protein